VRECESINSGSIIDDGTRNWHKARRSLRLLLAFG